MALDDPKIFVAMLTWAVYSFLRSRAGRWGGPGGGRRGLSAIGFAIVLLNFLPINYFITTSHTF